VDGHRGDGRRTLRPEKALHSAAAGVAEAAKAHAKAGRWREALAETVKLKDPLAAFYETVMVMDKDDRLRRNRLALLSSIVVVFGPIADFTKLDFGKS
jgi:glycyl-tRNA synthetase beta chain